LLLLLALAIPSSPVYAGDARKAQKRQESSVETKRPERSVDKFLNGTDAEREVMLNDVMKSIAGKGYREVSLVPWFVMMAKNSRGREVLLLVDPVSLQAIEIEHEDDEIAAAPETAIPGLHTTSQTQP
jgi:hypothetical protein